MDPAPVVLPYNRYATACAGFTRCSMTICRGLRAGRGPSGAGRLPVAGWYQFPAFVQRFSNIFGWWIRRALARIHGRVKTDPAAADDRHSFTNRRFIAQYLEPGQCLWMIDTVYRGRRVLIYRRRGIAG